MMIATSPAPAIPEWSEELSNRFGRALYDPDCIREWWSNPVLRDDDGDGYRRKLLTDLDVSERTFGPPTVRTLDARLQYEAQRDPDIPKWLRRPWYIPKDQILAAEAILIEAAGFGYSASGMSFEGETYLRYGRKVPCLDLVVAPVPGHIPRDRDVRVREESRIAALMTAAGIPTPRIKLWNDTEPDKAFHGMLSGRIIRLGHMALGIPYITNYGEP